MHALRFALVAILSWVVQGTGDATSPWNTNNSWPSNGENNGPFCPGTNKTLKLSTRKTCNTTLQNNSGCPVPKSNIFNFWGQRNEIAAGVCCINCIGGCPDNSADDKSPVAIVIYSVFVLLMIIAFRDTFWAKINGSMDAAIAAAKQGPEELKKFAQERIQDGAKNVTGKVKGDVKDAARGAASGAVRDATGFDTGTPTNKITFDEEYFDSLIVEAEIDPEEMCEAFYDKMEKKVCASPTVKYWTDLIKKTIDIIRKMSSEVLILVALTTIPPCQGGLETLCEGQGMFSPCCWPLTMFHVKRGVALSGTVLKLGLSMFYMLRIATNNGKPFYFPGSFSNDFYKAASGNTMRKAIPMDATLASGAKRKTVVVKHKKLKKDGGSREVIAPRVGFLVKYQLYLLGLNLFAGFWLVILDNLSIIMAGSCTGDMGAIWVAIKAMAYAAILQAPELTMYYWLFVALFFEWCFIWYCFFVKLCTFGFFNFRKFDEQDSDDFLNGLFTTRYSPPDNMNGFFKKIEKCYAVFYLWWFATIDTLPAPTPKAFYFLGPIPTPFPRFGSWIHQYADKNKPKPTARTTAKSQDNTRTTANSQDNARTADKSQDNGWRKKKGQQQQQQQPTQQHVAPPAASHVEVGSPPAAWDEILDPSSGRPYYVHRVTKESRWERPSELPPAPPPPSAPPLTAPKPSRALSPDPTQTDIGQIKATLVAHFEAMGTEDAAEFIEVIMDENDIDALLEIAADEGVSVVQTQQNPSFAPSRSDRDYVSSLAKAGKAFDRWDTDGDGFISRHEAAAMARHYRIPQSEHYIAGAWNAYDDNGDGVLDKEEFTRFFAAMLLAAKAAEEPDYL